MVLITSDTWPIDTPKIAGPICLRMRFTPASEKFTLGHGSMWMRRRYGS